MKRSFRPSLLYPASLRPVSLLFLATVGALLFSATLQGPVRAGGATLTVSQLGLEVPGSSAVQAGFSVRRESSSAAAHTAYLPTILNRPRPPADLRLGVQLYAATTDPSIVAKADQAGAGWVRVPFNWSLVEPVNTTPDNFTWPEKYDRFFTDLADRGIQVILTLEGNPRWAASYTSGPIDKVDMGEMVQFM